VQRPQDLDTACCLALLQEESCTPPVKDYKKFESNSTLRPYLKGLMPLPRPPLSVAKENVPDEKLKPPTNLHLLKTSGLLFLLIE
jgi:hypothetical protein